MSAPRPLDARPWSVGIAGRLYEAREGGAGIAPLSECRKSPTSLGTGSCVPGVSPVPSHVGQGSTCVPVVVTEIVLPPPQRQHRAMDQSSPCAAVYLCLLFRFRDLGFLLRHGSSGSGAARLSGSARLSKRAASDERVGGLPPGFLRTMGSFPCWLSCQTKTLRVLCQRHGLTTEFVMNARVGRRSSPGTARTMLTTSRCHRDGSHADKQFC
jgi:hypothetical protein